MPRREEAIIIDVTCPFDNRLEALRVTRRIEEKYLPIKQHLRRYQRVAMEAVVVGALGSWDPANDWVMCKLCSKTYFTKLESLSVSNVIAASRDIYAKHISGT